MYNEREGIEFAGRPPAGICVPEVYLLLPIPAALSNATGSPIKNATVIIEVDPPRSSITVLLARISYC